MQKIIKHSSNKVGLPPGSIVFVGDQKTDKVRITVFDYDQHQYIEKEVSSVEECFPYKDTPTVTWINIDGLQQADVIQKLDDHFGIHSLVLEDILHTEQRPKMEDFGDYIYVVLRMLYDNPSDGEIYSEQISLLIGPNYVISFQEEEGDFFDPIRERIRQDKGRVRKMGADYLAYVLIDVIVDHYFLVLEKLGDEIAKIEEDLMSQANFATFQQIHLLKRNMLFLRRSIWPLREVISALQRSESTLIKKNTMIFLKDVYDHTIQVIDTIETYRDMLSGMLDIYLSSMSNRMNEVMKVLTIISTIFIPLTFITGIYGMNFRYIPQLESPWGFWEAVGVMMIVALGMIFYFRRKRWF